MGKAHGKTFYEWWRTDFASSNSRPAEMFRRTEGKTSSPTAMLTWPASQFAGLRVCELLMQQEMRQKSYS
jgi:hypothetical protein